MSGSAKSLLKPSLSRLLPEGSPNRAKLIASKIVVLPAPVGPEITKSVPLAL